MFAPYRPGQKKILLTRARENSTIPFFRHTHISVFIFYAVYCNKSVAVCPLLIIMQNDKGIEKSFDYNSYLLKIKIL